MSDTNDDRQRLRDDLSRTLDALEAKVNVPKRVNRGVAEVKAAITILREERPGVFATGVVGAVTVVGAVGFLIIRSLARN